MSSPAQVCGVPYTEMQEFGQTFGGSPAGLQPRSMPRASPGDLWQNHLHGCGLRLVFLSLATGTFYNLSQNCLHEKYSMQLMLIMRKNNTTCPDAYIFDLPVQHDISGMHWMDFFLNVAQMFTVTQGWTEWDLVVRGQRSRSFWPNDI